MRAPTPRSAPRATALAATALVACLALAGCGGDDSSPSGSASPAAQKLVGGSELSSTWPLTGLPVSGGQSSSLDHPVMVVKMDNTEASAPQLGLSKADMVVEELVEGGLTRLAVFYYSDIPGTVGPVRSMRASDIGIVGPAKADVVTSGAAPVTIKRIQGAGISFFSEGAPGFSRSTSRSAPYNLFDQLDETVKQKATSSSATRPPDYLPFGDAKSLPAGPKATTIAAQFSGGTTTNWVYKNGGYTNLNTHAAADDQFPADNVLVLRVKVGNAGYLDPAGNPVPETDFTGKGAALLFSQGRLVRGDWSKSSLQSPIKLTSGGKTLDVPAGHTWIELVPMDGGNVTWKK